MQEEILKIAESLGQALASSLEFAELKRLENAVRHDGTLNKLTMEYQAQLRRIVNLEKNMQAVEVDDKRKLEELRDKVQADAKIQDLLKAQFEYTTLMNRVNRAITEPLQLDEDADEED